MSSEERELSLISKVEMRIALAATDEKLESLLDVYFAPLLLKLGSESLRVREKVISICRHLNTRIEPSQISLPVSKLVEQFKKDDSTSLIRQFDLIYIRMGLRRMSLSAQLDLLPTLLDGIAGLESQSIAAVVFNQVLKLLNMMPMPYKPSPDEPSLRTKLGITPETAQFLAKWFGKLLLFTPAPPDEVTCPGLSEAEYRFINSESVPSLTWNPEAQSGLNLTATKITVARFLASGAFFDSERCIPAIIASADSNSNISDIADDMLRRFNLDLENSDLVDELFSLYLGRTSPHIVPPVRTALRTKILSLLCKSAVATRKIHQINQLICDGLLSAESLAQEGLQAAKLRNQIFSFVAWFARTGSKDDLNRISHNTMNGLSDYIAISQGWPSPTRALTRAEIDLRSLAFETIGVLISTSDMFSAGGTPALFIHWTQWLFISLSCDNSHGQISVSIEKALGALLTAISSSTMKISSSPFSYVLFRHLQYKRGEREATTGCVIVRSTKFSAVRFANGSLPFSDVTGRWYALMASGDEATEVAEEGRKGLDPYWYAKLNPQRYATRSSSAEEKKFNSRYQFPQFVELVEYLFNPDELDVSTGAPGMRVLCSKPFLPVYHNTMKFLRNLFLTEALEPARTALDADESDWGHRLDSVISTDEESRKTLRKFIQASEPGPLLTFLQALAPDSLIQDADPGKSLTYLVEIAALAPDSLLERILPISASLSAAIIQNPPLDQRVAARILGILGSHSVFQYSPSYNATEIMDVAVASVLTAQGQAVRKACGTVLTLGYWFSRMSLRNRMDDKLADASREYLKFLIDLLEKAKNSDIRNAALVAIGQIGLAGLINSNTLPDGCSITKLSEIILPKGMKGDMELAVQTWGRVSSAAYLPNAQMPPTKLFEQLTKPLYDLFDVRDVEVQFAIGEALCVIAVGWKSKSLVAEFDVEAPWPESVIPDDIIAIMLDNVLERCKSLKPSEKKSSIIWLLSLVRYCGDNATVQESLRRCQAAFLRLLSDRDEIVQDSASRGLSLVYEMGNREFKDDLVRDLVQFFTADSSKLSGGTVMSGTELFEEGELPTGDHSSIKTYKDIVNLASEVGNPSLVYKFMSLASNKAMWTGRAAFGKFGLSNVLSDSSVGGYLAQNPKLYPKLYRYMFDPNPNVRSSMKTIWDALVKDTKAVIDEHFDGIMEELLRSIMNGKEWRVREASCLAISDLIQSQSIEKYDKYLQEILTKAFKVLDDIKGSVRIAAFKLARTLTNIAIRTLETGDARSKRANLMLGHLVPFLMGPGGLESSAQEVQQFSMATLMEIIKKCPKDTLRPLAAPIMKKYLLSLSSLEPQAANYLHLNADKYNMTSSEVDSMRLTALRASPMMEVVERYLLEALLHPDSIEEAATTLHDVIKSAIGMPSKMACTSVLITLCSGGIVFKPYADRFLQLARAQVFDRDQNVSAAYCVAIGHLARLATDSALVKTMSWTKDLYFTGDQETSRLVAGEVLQAISRYAPDQFKGVEGVALPLVFVGTHDTDSEVKEWFDKVWENNVSGTRAVMLYFDEILALVKGNLASTKWAVKHTCALTVAGTVKALGNPIEASMAEKLWPQLRDALAGRTWEGKEKVLATFPKFVDQARGFWQGREDVAAEMTAIALREARRNNQGYKPHALRCLGEYAAVREDVDLAGDAVGIGRDVWDQIGDTGMEVDSGDALKLEEDTLSAVVEFVLRCLNPSTGVSALAEHIAQATPMVNGITSRVRNAAYTSLFTGLASFFDRLSAAEELTPSPEFQSALASFLDTTLFIDTEISFERIRLARATAVLKFVQAARKHGKEVLCVEAGQREVVGKMLDAERSFEVRKVLGDAKGLLADLEI